MNDANEQPPVTVGDKLRVRVDDVAFGGDGVAHVVPAAPESSPGGRGNYVIFAPFVIPGEEAEVEITEVKKRFARARLLSVVKASPERVPPGCRYFGVCGGCQYQHMIYPRQLEMKRKQVRDVLERLGGVRPELVEAVIPCPQPYGYRNRIMVRSQWDKFKILPGGEQGGLNIGFIRADSRLVVDIEECPISEPVLNEQLRRVRASPPPKGGLKVVLRVAPEEWEVPADSFFQNNFYMLPALVEAVGSALSESKARFLVDAYCGVGFFGIELADRVERYVGVEVDPRAVAAARRNAEAFAARRHGAAARGEFVHGRAEEVLPALLRAGQKFPPQDTSVIVDPPRTGCPPEMLEMLRQSGPKQVIYVSCHPATLARDLNALTRDGVFDVVRVKPLDMFPQTQHVECVVALRSAAGPDND